MVPSRNLERFLPELRFIVQGLPSPDLGSVTDARRRHALLQPTSSSTVVPLGTDMETVFIPRLGRPPLELQVVASNRASSPRGAILWIHGGGFVMGSAAADVPATTAMSHALGAVVVSPDYRLDDMNRQGLLRLGPRFK